jgi:GT2 family glycosyltransferase/glycosyltransferase involved in cell wall biosynthesis
MQDSIYRLQNFINQKKKEIKLKNTEMEELVSLINGLYSSLSWKVTQPLRRFHAFLNKTPYQQARVIPKPDLSASEDEYNFLADLTLLMQAGKAPQTVVQPIKIDPVPVIEILPSAIERDTMLDFFVFPIIDWEFRYQRPQQIASTIAKRGHRIFYFKTVFNRYQDVLTDQDLKIKQLDDNIYQVTLATMQPVNVYRDLVHGKSSMDDLLKSIAVLKRKYAIKNSISIIDHPFWWPVARLLKNNFNVYDCMDDHSGFDNNKNIETYEPSLIAETDLVVVSSEKLLSMVTGIAKNVIQVKNGTDFNHFHFLPDSDVLKTIGKPIIGYYGAIAEWFDVNLIETCARKFKDYQFVLIGNVTNTYIPRLKELNNVHLLGEIKYVELPKYVKYFDVCLIPFKITKLIEATNPVKFYEYLSSGKPVVSVMLPELVPYRDLCYLSQTPAEFCDNIKLALDEKNKAEARVELARNNSWGHRGETFFKGISNLFPSVSVVVVTYNNLPLSKACYQSLKKYSRYPNLEIIFVDNNSTDGTPAWLEEIRQQDPRVKIILNNVNYGFAKGNNQGLKIATGEYFVFLNNDTIVTNNWLESLLQHLIKERSIGIICPVTNNIGNDACIRVDYTDLDGIQQFAYNYTERNIGLNRNLRMVPLFCAMMRTELLRKVGGLNEDYKQGMFEDDDLNQEIKKLGFRISYAEDVFVHHFGRMSFKKIPTEEYQELFKANKAIFEKKWGKWIPPIRGWSNIQFTLPSPT